ncbi:MAG: phosphoribosylformylglycinamidine cyclo-ligase [Actinomycetota bacterium]|nr:phosphoribosylformylglycinamidine cyclo-ligase [Actinomycetota bacterium]
MGESYAAAGVDIAAGEEAVERIKAKVRTTYRPEVVGDLGGFGGMFAFDPARYADPVLVSSTDSVGTKGLVARQAGRFDTIGLDLVAMVVDDIAAQGAEPLFFLDTILVGRLDPAQIEQLVGGIVAGCRQAGCALIGGEMAELPGLLEPGKFDLVGFAVGVVERTAVVNGRRVEPGDRLIGLPSPGLRCNGYSLARRVLLEEAALPLDGPAWTGAGHTLADELLRPSVIYSPALLQLQQAVDVRALAHITGGGLQANLARALPPYCDGVVEGDAWPIPEIFGQIRRLGRIAAREMARVFNLGIGMVAVVPAGDVPKAMSVLKGAGIEAVEIGGIVAGTGTVRID